MGVYNIVIEGAGDVVTYKYRPALRALGASLPISVVYADDTRIRGGGRRPRPPWATRDPKVEDRLADCEEYLDKADPKDRMTHSRLRSIDAVVVAVPPDLHAALATPWISRARVILVEKPFVEDADDLLPLRRALVLTQRRDPRALPALLGIDHYVLYAAPFLDHAEAIFDHLDDCVERVDFVLAEGELLKASRIPTLQSGMVADLWPHGLALSSLVGALETRADIEVTTANRYSPLLAHTAEGQLVDVSATYKAETDAMLRHTLQSYAPGGGRVVVESVVGKGVPTPAKYLEVWGRDGRHSCRIDFNHGRQSRHGVEGAVALFCYRAPGECACVGPRVSNTVRDGTAVEATLVERDDMPRAVPIPRLPYEALFRDLVTRKSTTLAATLSH